MKKFRYMLPIFLVALCILGLSFSSANSNEYKGYVTITGAPSRVQVCTEFKVDLVIGVISMHYDGFWLEVVVDTNHMKIVDFIVHQSNLFQPQTYLSPDGGRFRLYSDLHLPRSTVEGPLSYATLTVHCEGPGSSVIVFDRSKTLVDYSGIDLDLEYEEPTVNQYVPAPTSHVVGGYSIPVSRLSVVAPHIALVALIVAITATVMIKKNRKL